MKILAQDHNSILGAAARSWAGDRMGPIESWGAAKDVIMPKNKPPRTMSGMLLQIVRKTVVM